MARALVAPEARGIRARVAPVRAVLPVKAALRGFRIDAAHGGTRFAKEVAVMFRSLHIASTGMSAQETHLEGVANNISNANTAGYKRQRVEFQDLLYQNVREAGAPTGPNTMSPTTSPVPST